MWYLTNLHTDKVVFVKDRKTTIGRKGTDIEVKDDSLSRIHAFFILDGDNLKVQDAKSKYGTYLNNNKQETDRLQPEVMNELKDGDTVQFGKFNCEWTAHRLEYKTAISMLDQEKREKLTKILNALKVSIANDFDGTCSHLTMPMHTSVSVKLLQALTLCKPVVNPKFWVALQESFSKNLPIPKYIDYLPKVREETFIAADSVSLALDENRRKVFAGKIFIFISTSQMETFEDVIKNGGGKCVSMSKAKLTMSQCCAKSAVVIQCKDNATQSMNDGTISKIRAALSSKKRRMVPEMEIGTAVLHVSTEVWCNPNQSAVASLMIKEGPSESQLRITKSKTLVHDSLQPSELMGPPAKKPKERVQMIPEVVNLDSDEEEQEVNKENVPESMEVQGNPVPEIHETQPEVLEELPEVVEKLPEVYQRLPEDNKKLPEVDREIPEVDQDSPEVDREMPEVLDELPETHNFHEFEPPNVNKTPAQLPETQVSIPETQNHELPETQDSFISAVDKSQSRSTNKSSASVMSDGNLFNFTSSDNSRNNRKRKNQEIAEKPEVGKKTAGNQAAKKTRMIVDEDSDEDQLPPPAPKPPTRKRPAADAGGLFTFNTSFAKRLKPVDDSQELDDTAGPSGIVPMTPRPAETTTIPDIVDHSDDSCDSGIWLSRAMTTVSIGEDTTDHAMVVVKTEPVSQILDDSQVPLSKIPTLFLETSSNNSTISSMHSKRKQFVKKQNFRPQTSVVTMKVVRVEDTLGIEDF